MRPRRKYRKLQAAFALFVVIFIGICAWFWRWVVHDATGFFTGLLCLITFALACATYALFRATVDVSEEAATAAEKNDRMREVLERTYVSGGGVRVMINLQFGQRTLSQTFWIHINNHGRSPAELHEISYGFGPVERDKMPEVPPYQVTVPFFDSIAPGAQGKPTARITIPTSEEPQALFVRFHYLDTFLNRNCSAGFIIEIKRGEEFPVPIAAPPKYTERT
jgi:hypothetical protein